MCTVCLSCPKASLTLQHDCFVPCKWLSWGRINLPLLVFAFQPLSYVLSSFFALAWHVLVLEFALLALKHHLLPFLYNGNKIAKVKPTRQKVLALFGSCRVKTNLFLSSACRSFSNSIRSFCWRLCSSSAFITFSCAVMKWWKLTQ